MRARFFIRRLKERNFFSPKLAGREYLSDGKLDSVTLTKSDARNWYLHIINVKHDTSTYSFFEPFKMTLAFNCVRTFAYFFRRTFDRQKNDCAYLALNPFCACRYVFDECNHLRRAELYVHNIGLRKAGRDPLLLREFSKYHSRV